MSPPRDGSTHRLPSGVVAPVTTHVQPKLAIGTVQFGLPYGFVRPDRPVDVSEVHAILDFAWRNDVDMLDTAAGYGDAEKVIAATRPAHSRFRIISKMAPIDRSSISERDVDRVITRARQSREQLGVVSLDALLVHHAPDLLASGGSRLYRALSQLRADGLARRIGVSVYDPATMWAVLDAYQVDVVQLPLNVLDQRFLHDGGLDEAAKRGIEVHVRSAFLQGVLLADPERLPQRFNRVRAHLAGFHADAASAGLSRTAAALGFLKRCCSVARIVVGVDSLQNLQQNLHAFDTLLPEAPALEYARYAIDDHQVIDPRQW